MNKKYKKRKTQPVHKPTTAGLQSSRGTTQLTLRTQRASQTRRMPAGGLFMVLTTAMSAGVSVLSAATAALRTGIASARLASHSSLIADAASACSFATVYAAPAHATKPQSIAISVRRDEQRNS